MPGELDHLVDLYVLTFPDVSPDTGLILPIHEVNHQLTNFWLGPTKNTSGTSDCSVIVTSKGWFNKIKKKCTEYQYYFATFIWTVLTCLFKPFLYFVSKTQVLQLYLRTSSEWMFLVCSFMFDCFMALLHLTQIMFSFSWCWFFMCLNKLHLFVNIMLHFSHWCISLKWDDFMCRFKLPLNPDE